MDVTANADLSKLNDTEGHGDFTVDNMRPESSLKELPHQSKAHKNEKTSDVQVGEYIAISKKFRNILIFVISLTAAGLIAAIVALASRLATGGGVTKVTLHANLHSTDDVTPAETTAATAAKDFSKALRLDFKTTFMLQEKPSTYLNSPFYVPF